MKIKKIIIFDNDEDFEQYALKPGNVFHESEISPGMLYYDVDYSDQYNKDVEEGVQFCIDCEDSKIRKHNCIPRGMIMKKVENIIPFLIDEEELKIMYPKAEIVNYKEGKNDMNSAAEDKLSEPTKPHKGKLKIRPVTIDKSGNFIPIDDKKAAAIKGKWKIKPETSEESGESKPNDSDKPDDDIPVSKD